MEQMPVTAMMTNKTAVLFGLTRSNLISFLDFGQKIEHIPAQIRENHATPKTGTKILLRSARWCVKKRSMSGPVMMAINMPLKTKQAPKSPQMFAEYPIGCYMIQSESGSGINLKSYKNLGGKDGKSNRAGKKNHIELLNFSSFSNAHLALRTEKMKPIIAKSNRSRMDMYASGSTFIPRVARHREVKEGVFLDAAYAITMRVSEDAEIMKRTYFTRRDWRGLFDKKNEWSDSSGHNSEDQYLCEDHLE